MSESMKAKCVEALRAKARANRGGSTTWEEVFETILKTLRDPTEEMVEAGSKHVHGTSNPTMQKQDAATIHRAMIDAALALPLKEEG